MVLGNGNSLLTEDGGETWRLQTTSQSARGLQRVTFRSDTYAWGLGGGGAYITEDQGVTWKSVPVRTGDNTEDNLFAMFMEQTNPEFSEEPETETEEETEKEIEEKGTEEPTLQYDETPEEIQNRVRAQRQRPGRLAPEGELPPNTRNVRTLHHQDSRQPPPPPESGRRRRGGGRRIASVYFLERRTRVGSR